jgi:Na+/melibiose symporter-like transporter
MVDFLSGVIFALSLTASVFFVRFWRQSADRLFAIFALAFATFAASRLVLALLEEGDEARTWVYLLRLVAFVLIVVAVVDKNRAGTRA